MGSLSQLKQSFNPDELKMLDVAYASAWAKLERRDPAGAEAVKDFLRLKIVQIAKCGIRDPNELSALALAMLPSHRRSSAQKRIKAIPSRRTGEA